MQDTGFAKFKQIVGSRLQELNSQDQSIEFWWRDDDASQWTPELERLVDLSDDYQVPLFLAVIPQAVDQNLPDNLRSHSMVTVLQHGYAHVSRASEGQKKCEFPEGLNEALARQEILDGKNKLSELFAKQFHPVFVPPWNRLAQPHLNALKQAGHQLISCYGETSDPFYFNTHFDIINWKGDRSFIGEDKAIRLMLELLAKPLDQPIGLLTHHLDHDPALWGFLDFLFPFLKEYANVSWPEKSKLFSHLI